MSPDIAPVRARTAACASGNAHGWAAEQAVPVPEGEAKRVVVAAAAGEAGAARTAAAVSPIAATAAGTSRRIRAYEDTNCIAAHFPKGAGPRRTRRQLRVHFWLAPPVHVQSSTSVPLAVASPVTSRHSPDCTPVTVPSALRFHCWLAPPVQSQITTLVPGAVPLPSASRHL